MVIDPLSFPRSCFFVIVIAHASDERSRKPIPICPKKRMKMKPIRKDSGLIKGIMRSEIEAISPPIMMKVFRPLFEYKSI